MRNPFEKVNFRVLASLESVLFFVFLCLSYLYCFPWHPDIVGTGIDPSWRLAFHYFFGKSFVFGKDIIFSHGPYGFVNTWVYYPATYIPLLWIHLAIIALYAAASWDYLKQASSNHWITFCLSCALSLSWNKIADSSFPRDVFFYSGVVLCFFRYWQNWDKSYSLLHYLTLIFLAFSCLVKTTYFMAAIVVIVFITLDEIVFKKKPPVSLFLFLGAFCTLWILAGQPLTAVFNFMVQSYSYSVGYGAMSGREPHQFVYSEILFLIYSVFIAVGLWLGSASERRIRLWPAWISLSALLLLIYRAAFTRQDHESLGVVLMAVISIYLFPRFFPFAKGKRRLLFFCLVGLIISPLAYAYKGIGGYDSGLKAIGDRFTLPIRFALMKDSAFRSRLFFKQNPPAFSNVEKIIKNYTAGLDKFDGTFDVFPYDSAIVITGGKEYAPRPVFQSHAVFSGSMSKINAKHLKSDQAAEFLLVRSNTDTDGLPFDDFYPPLFDSLSALEMLSRYEVAGHNTHYMVLKKRSQPRESSLRLLSTKEFNLGDTLITPMTSQGLVWAEFEFQTTWVQKIFEFLGKSFWLNIFVENLKGETRRYRFSPTLSETGLILSPLIKADDEAALLHFRYNQKLMESSHVSRFKLEKPAYWGGDFFIKSKAKVSFYSLELQ